MKAQKQENCQDGAAWSTRILGSQTRYDGTPNNLYQIVWFYMANHGAHLAWAKDEKEAFDNFLYSKNTDVRILITKVDPTSMPTTWNGWRD